MPLAFEWHPGKAQAIWTKHQVGSVEAASVFMDPLARIFIEHDHSIGERREIIIGHSRAHRLLLVCFTEVAANRIRIINARRATKGEQRDYEEHVTI